VKALTCLVPGAAAGNDVDVFAVHGDGRLSASPAVNALRAGKAGIVDEFAVRAGGALTPIGSVTVPGGAGGEGIAAA
jgi:hypothetical protein